MLAGLARKIADRLAGALELPEEAAERAAYALELVFLDMLTLGSISVVSMACGLFWPAMTATVTSALMRSVSGGAHSSSPWRCIVLSTVLAVLFGFLGRFIGRYMITPLLVTIVGCTCLVGSLVIYYYGPADTPAKPLSTIQRIRLRYASFTLLILWACSMFVLPLTLDLRSASILAILWQISTLTPIVYGFSRYLDRLWSKGGDKECAS